MAIIQVNSEGVETLKKTSQSLTEAVESLKTGTNNVKSQIEEYSESLGDQGHYESLERALETIQRLIDQSTDSVGTLVEKLNDLAGKYQEWIDDDPFGGIN